MRFVLVALVLSWIAVPAFAAPPDISGSWTVTSTETATGSCVSKPGTVFTHVWIVTQQPDGTLGVVVNGETSTPKLDGTVDDKGISLVGYTKLESKMTSYRADAAWIRLEKKGAELVGIRRFMTIGEVRIGDKRVQVPCFLDMTVTAKR